MLTDEEKELLLPGIRMVAKKQESTEEFIAFCMQERVLTLLAENGERGDAVTAFCAQKLKEFKEE